MPEPANDQGEWRSPLGVLRRRTSNAGDAKSAALYTTTAIWVIYLQSAATRMVRSEMRPQDPRIDAANRTRLKPRFEIDGHYIACEATVRIVTGLSGPATSAGRFILAHFPLEAQPYFRFRFGFGLGAEYVEGLSPVSLPGVPFRI